MQLGTSPTQDSWWDDTDIDKVNKVSKSDSPLPDVNTSALDDINFDLGIPSEIKIIAPGAIPAIEVIHDIPKAISIKAPEIPKEIRLMHDLPESIKLDAPDVIKLDAPESIKLDTSTLVEEIRLVVPDDFPNTIRMEAIGIPDKIQVDGVPDVIELIHNLPDKIDLVVAENQKVEMVYEGSPIEFKINLDIDSAISDDGDGPCVMITPCRPKK